MELKLANTEENSKEEGGLRLSGGLDKPGTDTRSDQTNPWDFDRPEGSYTTRSISSSAVANTSTYKRTVGDVHIVVKIGRIVVYVCMLFMIIALVWIGTHSKMDIYCSARKFSLIFSVCEFALIVDAILVNILYEKKLSLLLWAWLLGFVYPMKRDKHVSGGSSWGTWVCVGMIVVGLPVSVNMMAGYLNYGVAIMNENDAERAAIEAFMEQSAMDSGETFGERLKKNFLIYNLEFETQGNQTILVFQGIGRYGVDEDSFLDYGSKTVETQFAFVKDSSGNYQLAAAILGNTQLSERKMNYYWKNIIQ